MPLRLALLTNLLFLLATGAHAQQPLAPEAMGRAGGCDRGSARGEVSAAGVRASLFNGGTLFWSGNESLYEVPRGSGKSPLFAAALWVGGEVDGDARIAGAQYAPDDYWPGTLDASGAADPARCDLFDRFWKVATADLRAYTTGGASSADLAGWPIAQGAPFYVDLDGDDRRDPATEPRIELEFGDPGYSVDLGGGRQIDLASGERPDLIGDEAVWWVMNDAGNTHAWVQGEPLGIEVRVLAYSILSPEAGLDQSTFYEVTVTNRSTETITDSRVSLFADFNIGTGFDDYVSGDPSRGMMVAYNGDAFDGGPSGYGASPPALGVDILSGASGAILDFDYGSLEQQVRNAQQNRWWDGRPIRRGGSGLGSTGDVTSWIYDGDAVRYAYWSAEKLYADTSGADSPTYRRGIVNAPALTLAPGESRRVDLALLFAEGGEAASGEPRPRLHNVSRLRDISDAVQSSYDARGSGGLRDASVSYTVPPLPPPPTTLVAPAEGTDFDAGGRPATVTFAWEAVPGADIYLLQLGTTPNASSLIDSGVRTHGTSATVSIDRLPADASRTGYWRVLPVTWGGAASGAEVRSYRVSVYRPGFASFQVVANASGTVSPPEPGAAAFAGFPTPGGEDPGEAQQATDARWLISTGGRGTYEEFVDRVLRGGSNGPFVFPFDYEARFTATSLAYRAFQDDGTMEIPFEIWNIGVGTPDNPADDFRMIPLIFDIDGDGTYNLSTQDSPISGEGDDPETDWIYWYDPVDTSPGEAGYLAWEASGNAAFIGSEALARTTFVGWDLGKIPPYAALYPEPGTVFRIVTNKPIPIADERGPSTQPLAIEVYPNPARGRATVPFRLDTPGVIRLSVVDVLGREVSILASGAHASGSHRAELDTSGLAAGVYVVVLRRDGQRVTRTVTVVR